MKSTIRIVCSARLHLTLQGMTTIDAVQRAATKNRDTEKPLPQNR